ncbi:Kelch motif family protein [Tritrichomonas foetus]|uniref:Kelch motif family protein n=1 Tax=Tritrichomonas foetus TaxID=1144522 RepID=A0A1J4J8V9_9EUKA|nr:Kelch motif family protein [Tritrichomonas foetus]|eukprot:OHS94123.1 Kelch motif family protein [Tritrichomonas foetus]
MGNDQSARRQTHELMYDSFLYAPVISHRTEAEYTSRFVPDDLPQMIATKTHAPLLKTAYRGVWSMDHAKSLGPASRIGQCHVYDSENNSIIIAYGSDIDGKDHNDLWSLNLNTMKWRKIASSLLPPRNYASAVLIGREMYVFGGAVENHFYADLHHINIDTGKCELINCTGEQQPCPRTSPMLFHKDNKIYLWSGFDGRAHGGIYSIKIRQSENTQENNQRTNQENYKENEKENNHGSYLESNQGSYLESNQGSYNGNYQGDYRGCHGNDDELLFEWKRFDSVNTGLAAPTHCHFVGNGSLKGVDKYFVFGGVNGSPITQFIPEKGEFNPFPCIGTIPSTDLTRSTLLPADEYMFLIGGEASIAYMHIFALDVKRKWWFAFHVRPDNNSLSIADGTVNKVGLFMLPREHSAAVVYSPTMRSIFSVMGSRMMEPPPIFKIEIGEALASLHQRSDMLDMIEVSSK